MVKTRPRLLAALATAHVRQGLDQTCRLGADALVLTERQQVTSNLEDLCRLVSILSPGATSQAVELDEQLAAVGGGRESVRRQVWISSVSESSGRPRRPAQMGVGRVSWADAGSAVTAVVRCDLLVPGPDVAPSGPTGPELGRHCRGGGRSCLRRRTTRSEAIPDEPWLTACDARIRQPGQSRPERPWVLLASEALAQGRAPAR